MSWFGNPLQSVGSRAWQWASAVVVWALAAVFLVWWTHENPLPDGFQNEYLHVGNAYDLWGALRTGDTWHLRWFMYTGYWPWGFYAVPWPSLALLGPSKLALLTGNLAHLGVLLWGTTRLSRTLDAPWAVALLVVCPGVFGSLVRYEPNLAIIAWTIAGISCLVLSQGLRRRREVVGFGVCLGIGLMVDRLSVGFFLVPAALPLVLAEGRREWRNLARAGAAALFLTFAYYREFFLRHTDELLGQAPVGEIDAAGQVTVGGGLIPALYYPLTLLDSQAGIFVGLLMLLALVATVFSLIRRASTEDWSRVALDARATLVFAVVPAVLFFTVIAKKQVFYTLPILGPLALLAGTYRRVAPVAVAAGLWGIGTLGIGWAEPNRLAGPFLPLAWVAPRHAVAHPPGHDAYPFDDLVAAMDGVPDAVLVMSEDQRLFEGYLALALRERLPDAQVRGVITDPIGTYELFQEQDVFVWAGPVGGDWPTEEDIERELLSDHYDIQSLPPVAEAVAIGKQCFAQRMHTTARMEEPVSLIVFQRTTCPGSP